MTISHGVDGEQHGQAVEAITEEQSGGQYRFRAETVWTDGLPRVATTTGKEVNDS